MTNQDNPLQAEINNLATGLQVLRNLANMTENCQPLIAYDQTDGALIVLGVAAAIPATLDRQLAAIDWQRDLEHDGFRFPLLSLHEVTGR